MRIILRTVWPADEKDPAMKTRLRERVSYQGYLFLVSPLKMLINVPMF